MTRLPVPWVVGVEGMAGSGALCMLLLIFMIISPQADLRALES